MQHNDRLFVNEQYFLHFFSFSLTSDIETQRVLLKARFTVGAIQYFVVSFFFSLGQPSNASVAFPSVSCWRATASYGRGGGRGTVEDYSNSRNWGRQDNINSHISQIK